jgi:5-(carboxyamino)imidazole ribonucleotide synthase
VKYDIGFLGGGQLARMSIQAAQRMGLTCLSLDASADTPASQVADAVVGPLNDPDAVAGVFRLCERVTLENEFIPALSVEAAIAIAGRGRKCLLPGTECLATVQDKLLQRRAYERSGVPSPLAVAIEGDETEAVAEVGFPMALKARFGGYDGKGTRYARDRAEFDAHSRDWAVGNWMAEQFVPFSRELAVMVCRSESQTLCFPTMETVQVDHVCDLVFPSGTDASEVAVAAVESVGGFGLFGIELFELRDGEFMVNEIAPRPHNSGHYTLDWGGVSQFEAHVRLVLGLPVPTPMGGEACMANLLGQVGAGDYRLGLRAAIEADPEVHVHWYGKSEPRPGRKMGHINTVGPDCRTRAVAARERFYAAWARG